MDIAQFKSRYLAHSYIKKDTTAIVATEVASHLEVPWGLAWGPDNWLWFTEQKGTVSRLHPETGVQEELLQLKDLVYQKSRGLFDLALHPDFQSHPYVYLAYTYLNSNSTTKLRVVRYTYREDRLEKPFVVLENIPGETYHNGSRLIINPDRKLFITTGDAGNLSAAQDIKHPSGKVLRLNLDGSIPEDNPFEKNPVWTSGHRNAQGLVWATNGKMYLSEHGPDNDDEVNLILEGRNYGWPDVMGYCDLPSEKEYCTDSNVVAPLIAWSPVIAPAGLDYYENSAIPEWNNSLIMGSLKSQTLRILHLNNAGEKICNIEEWFSETFGRIRAVVVSPAGDVYISTSNKDWHPRHFSEVYQGIPKKNDDKIIKISKAKRNELAWLRSLPEVEQVDRQEPKSENETIEPLLSGAALYEQYCAGCHQMDGQGVENLYPPLAGSEWVTGDKKRLMETVLQGLSGPIEVKGKEYNQQMPAYRFLSDEQLSEVLSYIRKGFGNNAEPLSPEDVAAARAAL